MYLNLSKLILFRYNPAPWFVIIWKKGVTDVTGGMGVDGVDGDDGDDGGAQRKRRKNSC